MRLAGQHKALLGILALFVLLALVYNASLPLFEAPDELAHFRYVEWLAEGRGLPHVEEDLQEAGHEIGQPPLYYSLLALVVAPVNTHDLLKIAPPNPYYYESGAFNVYYHDLEAEGFPYQHTSLAVRLARFVSTLMALLTIVSAYGIMRVIAPAYAALAAALVAFNPQFIFISAAVSNDTLLAALSGLTLWMVVRQFARKETPWRLYAAVGLVWGLATLTKAGGLALGAPIGIGLLLLGWQRRSWQPLTEGAPLTGAAFLLSSGWWFARNWHLYGDPLAWDALLYANKATVRSELLPWSDTLQYAYTGDLWRSYWIMFGNRVILAPEQFYTFINLFVAAALIGLLLWLLYHSRQHRRYEARLAVVVLVTWNAVTFAALLRWMSQVAATDQGRLLFPIVSTVAVLLALGWGTLFRHRRWLNYAAGALGGWAVIAPFLLIEPAYSHPPPLPSDFVIPNQTEISYGEQIKLVGYELHTPVLAPGEMPTVDLYWQATTPIETNYVVAIHLLDGDGMPALKWDVAPYDARYPTTVWEPGVIFRDRYTLPPLPDWAAPGRGRLLLALYPRGNMQEPLAVSEGDVDLGAGYFFTEIQLSLRPEVNYKPERVVQSRLE